MMTKKEILEKIEELKNKQFCLKRDYPWDLESIRINSQWQGEIDRLEKMLEEVE